MSTQKLSVRVAPKSGAPRFCRCGLEFTAEWREVEVDAATAAQLAREQMLEAVQASGARDRESEKNVPETPVAAPVKAVKKTSRKAAS
jgi:hypothetical protein